MCNSLEKCRWYSLWGNNKKRNGKKTSRPAWGLCCDLNYDATDSTDVYSRALMTWDSSRNVCRRGSKALGWTKYSCYMMRPRLSRWPLTQFGLTTSIAKSGNCSDKGAWLRDNNDGKSDSGEIVRQLNSNRSPSAGGCRKLQSETWAMDTNIWRVFEKENVLICTDGIGQSLSLPYELCFTTIGLGGQLDECV